ncbi:DUF3800 domain-containing protein [Paracoccus sp. PARArs4]|uniref:DUF3800 domain-containing protein n=1 Tax=Paracoccus sp. PARArs4 TaxID=2853442 RepID=UPI0024A71DEC|nr:DUF3800 domain-containing protein [Paracoccus sp. PARArs4]
MTQASEPSIFLMFSKIGLPMDHHYTLFIDEAGDDKVKHLKPSVVDGNSEWLCLGGYLIRAEAEPDLDRRRDEILRSIGGQPGGVLHFQKLHPKNRVKATQTLATRTNSARGFVVCSCKRTMLNHHNARAAAVTSNQRDYLYNWVVRLLLERVTAYVANHAQRHGIKKPVLRIVMASRRGHHFGQFKAYVQQLINQATAGTTYLSTRQIVAEVLRYNLIELAHAPTQPGLQLADVLVSAFFQSIEQASPHHADKVAMHLRPLMAERRTASGRQTRRDGEGVTFFPDRRAVHLLTADQTKFFEHFGYDMGWLKSRKAQKHKQHLTQAQRMWSREA